MTTDEIRALDSAAANWRDAAGWHDAAAQSLRSGFPSPLAEHEASAAECRARADEIEARLAAVRAEGAA